MSEKKLNMVKIHRLDRKLSKNFKNRGFNCSLITWDAGQFPSRSDAFANVISCLKPASFILVACAVNEFKHFDENDIRLINIDPYNQFYVASNDVEVLRLLKGWEAEALVITFFKESELNLLPFLVEKNINKKISILGFEEYYLSLFGPERIICFISDSHDSIEVWANSENTTKLKDQVNR